jgi:hypothetical protein
MWHMLQVSDDVDREFLSALSELEPALGWRPRMHLFGAFQSRETAEALTDPPASLRSFPQQKGYSRQPIATLVQAGRRQVERMRRITKDAAHTPLICTTPYWADAAREWPGPVVYYLTDLMAEYDGANPSLVRKLDVEMCRAATLVCPNSHRIKDYLIRDARCEPARIEVVPNATRASNLLREMPTGPGPLPADLAGLERPIAGVIGNLAANMDWEFLAETVKRTPGFSWAFVGPVTMKIDDPAQRRARANLLQAGGRIRFTGRKRYGELCHYARAFDAAVLPYEKREPTYSGSSTRFYEHLAACRPMLATCGFHELLSKPPLLNLVYSPEDTAGHLARLQKLAFDDGYTEERWRASRKGTWHCRAVQVVSALRDRTPAMDAAASSGPRMAAGARS